MRLKFSAPLLLLLVLAFGSASFGKNNLEALAHKAVSEEASESAAAISQLRSLGPAGLSVLFQAHANEINRQIANPLLAPTPEWQRLTAALDAVSQQKDSYLSGLYWYTDFAQAKAAARTAGKPIVSLRLLGKLSEEFSCANSRFFRTVLYSNTEVSKALRERFILHWQSVRPAPRVTIDFGDGRKLERTLTGNSIHYILDTDGKPIDALPGLYGPVAFLRSLTQIEEVFKQLGGAPNSKPVPSPSTYHRVRLNAINLDWLADTQKIAGRIPEGLRVVRNEDGTPSALEVASLAISKAVTETSLLRSMTAGSQALGAITDEAAWNKIAQLHMADAQLDARSVGLIQRQTQKLLTVEGSSSTDQTLANLVQKLQMNIALDTVRNEYLLHTKLHAWLIADRSRSDLDALNNKVYAELFLTPAADPWLGLFSPETYMALDNGGVVR